MVNEIMHLASLGNSDHDGIYWEYETRSKIHELDNYPKEDYEKVKPAFKKVNWDKEFKKKNVEEAWNQFKEDQKNHPGRIQEVNQEKTPPVPKKQKTQQYTDYAENRKQNYLTK